MVYVLITTVTLALNPIKRFRFTMYATRRLLQARESAVLAESNSINGQFLTMTVWENLEDMFAFQESVDEVTTWSMKNIVQDVANDRTTYCFETFRLPTWEEAVELLRAVKNGEIHAVKSPRELMVEMRLRKSWRRTTASSASN